MSLASNPGTGAAPEYGAGGVERATLADAAGIHALVESWADRGDMLHRSIAEIYEHIREFQVIKDGSRIVGCSALHVFGPDLAEIRSIAVDEAQQGRGLGARLTDACVEEARQFGVQRVFALTYRPGFFERQGFRLAQVMEFPQKVWKECVRCPFFTDCREVAVVLDLAGGGDEPVPLFNRADRAE